MKILYVTTVGLTMIFFVQQFKHLMQQGHIQKNYQMLVDLRIKWLS